MGVVVTREGNRLYMQGKKGTLVWDSGQVSVIGENPLNMYGDPAIIAKQIADYAAVPETGDVMAFAIYENDSTVDFNDKYTLIALHGGLGGDQNTPFMMYRPSSGLDPTKVLEAVELHEKFAALRCRV